MLDIFDLMVFIEAADCGNFSKTGRNLHLSQPAISQKIDNLQKHFGTKLFYRDGRCMRLTESGQALIPLAKELISIARGVDETMISMQTEVCGELKIGCSTTSGKYLLPGIIASYREKYPSVRFNVQVTSKDLLIDRLLSGEFDVGVTSNIYPYQDLEYTKFFQDEIVLIVPPNHRWLNRGSIHVEEVLSEPIILSEEDSGTRELVCMTLQEYNISPDMLKVAMELGSAEAICFAVEQGIGIAFISCLVAARSIKHGYLGRVDIQGNHHTQDIYITRNKRKKPSRSQLEFWGFISSLYGNFDINFPFQNIINRCHSIKA